MTKTLFVKLNKINYYKIEFEGERFSTAKIYGLQEKTIKYKEIKKMIGFIIYEFSDESTIILITSINEQATDVQSVIIFGSRINNLVNGSDYCVEPNLSKDGKILVIKICTGKRTTKLILDCKSMNPCDFPEEGIDTLGMQMRAISLND